jgi:hypothetical protein
MSDYNTIKTSGLLSGNVTIGNVTLTGNLMPASNNVGQIGGAGSMFKHMYVGPSSLYINGQQTLSTGANTIVFSADADQTIAIQTSGTGDISFAPNGTGSVLLKGPLLVYPNKSISSSDGNPVQFGSPIGIDNIGSHTANGDITIGSANATGVLNGSGIVKTAGNFTAANITANSTITSANIVVTGNLTVSGTTTFINSTSLQIVDPVIELGRAANNAGLVSDDGKDRGALLHYYTASATREAFMGWDNSNAEFSFGSNVTESSGVMTFNTLGNVRAGYFLGNGSSLTGVTAASATTAGTVTTAAQPNITTVGTLTALALTGKLSANSSNGSTNQVLTSSGSGSTVTWTDIIHPFLLLG